MEKRKQEFAQGIVLILLGAVVFAGSLIYWPFRMLNSMLRKRSR
jgi:uncharacterized membrane protein YgdD (TMEM256/DUF423 family)